MGAARQAVRPAGGAQPAGRAELRGAGAGLQGAPVSSQPAAWRKRGHYSNNTPLLELCGIHREGLEEGGS